MSSHRAGRRSRTRPAVPAIPVQRPAAGGVQVAERPVARTTIVPGPTLVPDAGRGGRRAQRRAAARRRTKRLGFAGLAVAVAGALVAGGFALLGGGGHGGGKAAAAGRRTQTTLLLMITQRDGTAIESALLAHDDATGQGAIVLIPSQTVADVPGRGQLPFGQTSQTGAPRIPAETLGDLMGVTVDGTLLLNTAGFAALVDRAGGIDVAQVDTDVVAPGRGNTEQMIVSKGGAQHLSGEQAVAYATYRAGGEQEQARLARFTSVLTGLVDALRGGASADAAAVQALGGSATFTLPAARVGSVLAGLRADDSAGNLASETLPVQPVGTGDDLFTPETDQVAQLVQRYLAASVPPGRVTGHNRVIVVNGTGALGLGETAHGKLDHAGLVFVRSENQEGFSFRHKRSVVLVADDSPASQTLGHRVAAALGLPDGDIAIDSQPTTAADVVVILGSDYRP